MKHGFCLTLLGSLLVSAQNVADLPSCSLACFTSAIATTACGASDYACQCTPANRDAIKASVTPCLLKSTCSVTELDEIQQFGNTFCPNYLAAASNSASQASSAKAVTSSISHFTTPLPATQSTSVSLTPTSPASASATPSSISTHLGAGTDGTNWHSIQHKSPNYDRGPAIEAVCISLFVLAASIVVFRMYARFKTKQMRQVAQGPGWDELFACIALSLVGGIVATIITGVHYGMGKHQDHQTASELIHVVKTIYAFTLIITLAFCSLKLSILCLYLRMTPVKSHRVTIFAIMGFVVLYTIAVFFANMFECTPISAFWDLDDMFTNKMGCVNIITMDIITNSWSAFEDLVIWYLPIPILWKIKVPRAKKAGLYSLVGISFISVICAFVRVSAFVIWINSSEISWNFPLYPLLCTIETCVALITSSLPAIYALFRKPAPEHRRSTAIKPDSEKAWDSQESTLRSAGAVDRRSRCSFLAWHGFTAKKTEDGVEKEIKPCPESIEEEQPKTTHTMTAYVPSTGEGDSNFEKANSHRRKLSTETESLCYQGKATGRVSPISSFSEEAR